MSQQQVPKGANGDRSEWEQQVQLDFWEVQQQHQKDHRVFDDKSPWHGHSTAENHNPKLSFKKKLPRNLPIWAGYPGDPIMPQNKDPPKRTRRRAYLAAK